MANSYVTYTGNGSQTDWTFPFLYLDPSDIFVYVNGVSVPYTFITSSAIRATTAPVAAATVQIRRITNKTTVPVDFSDGSNLLEKDLDLLAVWALYVAQESADNSGDSTVALVVAQAAQEAAEIAAAAFPAYVRKQTFTATAAQALFTLSFPYAVGLGSLQVSINGVLQESSAYTETSTTSLTLSEGLSAGDVVFVRSSAP